MNTSIPEDAGDLKKDPIALKKSHLRLIDVRNVYIIH